MQSNVHVNHVGRESEKENENGTHVRRLEEQAGRQARQYPFGFVLPLIVSFLHVCVSLSASVCVQLILFGLLAYKQCSIGEKREKKEGAP